MVNGGGVLCLNVRNVGEMLSLAHQVADAAGINVSFQGGRGY